jgi:tetratricopeptide (TPR) repeat protein
MKKITILFLLLTIRVNAQRELDSLKNTLRLAVTDSAIVQLTTSVASLYYNLGNYDSSEIFSKRGIKEFERAEKNLPKKNRLTALIYYSYNFNTLGLINNIKGNYPVALNYFYKAIEIAEKTGDWGTLARCNGNIAMIFQNQNNANKAIPYYKKAINIYLEKKDTFGIGMVKLNLGPCYLILKDTLNAISTYKEAEILAEKINHIPLLTVVYGNLGAVYADQKKLKEAEFYLRKSLNMSLMYQAPEHVSRNYYNLGLLMTELKNYKEAFYLITRGLRMSDSIGNKSGVSAAYEYLSSLYERSNIPLTDSTGKLITNQAELRLLALLYYKKSIKLKKELEGEESQRKSLEQEARFEYEKKETLANAKREKEKGEEEARDKRNKLIIIVVCVILLIVAFFTYMVLKSLRQVKEQKQIVEAQKHLVEEKQKEILDSIHYAKRIQRALITNDVSFLKAIKQTRS